jgi:pyrroloquinoline quinone biosynthesis protein E
LPTRAQLKQAEFVTDAWREKLGRSMRIFFVAPDYHEGKAKKCVNGWGSMFLTVAPDGTALPCHTAKMLPGLAFPNVREQSLRDIWFDSEGFNRYRGTGWMKEPCSSCEHREQDLGGCRCQAYLIAQDAQAADPVCRLSPHHDRVLDAVQRAEANAARGTIEHPLVFRDPVNSRRLAKAMP